MDQPPSRGLLTPVQNFCFSREEARNPGWKGQERKWEEENEDKGTSLLILMINKQESRNRRGLGFQN